MLGSTFSSSDFSRELDLDLVLRDLAVDSRIRLLVWALFLEDEPLRLGLPPLECGLSMAISDGVCDRGRCMEGDRVGDRER